MIEKLCVKCREVMSNEYGRNHEGDKLDRKLVKIAHRIEVNTAELIATNVYDIRLIISTTNLINSYWKEWNQVKKLSSFIIDRVLPPKVIFKVENCIHHDTLRDFVTLLVDVDNEHSIVDRIEQIVYDAGDSYILVNGEWDLPDDYTVLSTESLRHPEIWTKIPKIKCVVFRDTAQ